MNLGELEILKSKPEVYINGRKVGHLSTGTLTSSSLTPGPPALADFKPFSGTFSFSIPVEDDETKKKMEEFVMKCRAEYIRKIDKWIGDCLRTRVVPPIKGEVTPGKIRWRGLELCFGPDDEFLGIIQRRKILYGVDGNTYPRQTKKEEKL